MNARQLQEENERLRQQIAGLLATVGELRKELAEPEEVFHAISRGEVDALVVREGPGLEEIYSLQRFKTLQEQEERFRLMVEGARDYAIYMVDPEGRVSDWNNGAMHIYGYTADEIVGQDRSRFFTPDDVANGLPRRRMQAAIASGYLAEEAWQVRKDGSRFWAHGTLNALPDAAGGTRGYVKVVRDLTERKRAEALLSAVSNSVTDGIIGITERGVIETFNRGAEKLFGYTGAEVLGQNIKVLMPDLDRGVPDGCLDHHLRTGEAEGIGLGRQIEGRRKDGSTFPIHLTVSEFFLEAVRHFTGVVRDITERKRAEEDLHLRDRAMRAVSQGILISDSTRPDNPIIYANSAAERLTGYRSEELVGRNCRFLQGAKTGSEVVAEVREAIRAGKECSVEILNYRKDGTPFWNALSITPVRDENGKLLHFVGVMADVTDRRNLEEQLRQSQKMEAVGQLAGGVAHDFNNLLTIISGYSAILLSKLESNDPMREAVKAISEAGGRAASLTRQLLVFSRKAILETKILDLNEVVQGTEKMLRRLIGEDILLTAVLDPQISRVKADPGQLDQVLMNLSVNARDAMPRGGKLTLETKNVELDGHYAHNHADARAGSYVMLAVSDSGGGMPPEVKAHIFEPFFTTKGVGKGTGLGLSVVHGIVKQSGGHIEVYSELDLEQRSNSISPPSKRRPPSPSRWRQRLTCVGMKRSCSSRTRTGFAGWLCSSCSRTATGCWRRATGGKALRAIEKHQGPIDLLVTDVVMPGMGGGELAETLRPRFPHMKVLFSSGYTDDSVVRYGILEQEVPFLPKPYSPQALARKVRQLLDQK